MSLHLSKDTEDIYTTQFLSRSQTLAFRGQLPGDSVVFVDQAGQPLCRIEDDEWPLPGNRGRWKWRANDAAVNRLNQQARHLLAHVLFHPDALELSLSTLGNYFNGLKALARACEHHGFQDLGAFFSDDRAGNMILDKVMTSPGRVAFLHIGPGLFNSYHRFGENVVGFRAVLGTTYERLRDELGRYNRRSFQHPVIPWGIYKRLLIDLSNRIDEKLSWLDDPAWRDVIRFHSVEFPRIHNARKMPSPSVKYIKANHPAFFRKVGSVQTLLHELGAMQELARLGIVVYTGCRRGEVSKMEAKAPEQVDEVTYLIYGRTTKSKNARVYWVTNSIGANALRLAMKVRSVIIDGLALDSTADVPLMPQLGGFPNNVRRSKGNDLSYDKDGKEYRTQVNGVLDRVGIDVPRIGSDDYDFLCELSRDCRLDLEKYAVGSKFPFSIHQFRRSLAYFLVRVGGIEFGTIKRQFKQMLAAMARYYTSNVVSSEAELDMEMPQLLDKERMLEIDERMRRHFTNFTELRGAMGTSIRRNIEDANADRQKNVILTSRKRMRKRVEQGEVSYIETPLGACLSVEPCISRVRAEVSACLSCPNAILEQSKLEDVFAELQNAEHPFFAAQAEHFAQFLTGASSITGNREGDTHE